MSTLAAALEYARAGASVIPVDRRKRPLLREWCSYQTRVASEDEIRSWWTQWPHAGVAIICGAVSGVVVLDIEADALDVLSCDPMPETPTVRTQGGGIHLYFQHDPSVSTRNLRINGRHVGEIRSDRSYVVAPPSAGEHGQYQWLRTYPSLTPGRVPPWVNDLVSDSAPRTRDAIPHPVVSLPQGEYPSRSEEDQALAYRRCCEGVSPERIAVQLRAGGAYVDRTTSGEDYIRRTIARAERFAAERVRRARIARVTGRSDKIVITLSIEGCSPRQAQIHLDWPVTNRSDGRWEALRAALELEKSDPSRLHCCRLRIELIPTADGYRVGRLFREETQRVGLLESGGKPVAVHDISDVTPL